MIYDPAKFRDGHVVRIAERSVLDSFARTWSYHHPLQSEQLRFAGTAAKVRASFMYHGGDVLYELEGVPGTWHERLLSAANSN